MSFYPGLAGYHPERGPTHGIPWRPPRVGEDAGEDEGCRCQGFSSEDEGGRVGQVRRPAVQLQRHDQVGSGRVPRDVGGGGMFYCHTGQLRCCEMLSKIFSKMVPFLSSGIQCWHNWTKFFQFQSSSFLWGCVCFGAAGNTKCPGVSCSPTTWCSKRCAWHLAWTAAGTASRAPPPSPRRRWSTSWASTSLCWSCTAWARAPVPTLCPCPATTTSWGECGDTVHVMADCCRPHWGG